MSKHYRKRDYVLERVTWLDHTGPAQSMSQTGLVTRHTVGWIVAETDHYIVTCSTLDRHRLEDLNTLGKGMITKREELRAWHPSPE